MLLRFRCTSCPFSSCCFQFSKALMNLRLALIKKNEDEDRVVFGPARGMHKTPQKGRDRL